MPKLIDVSNLTFAYEDMPVLENVSVQIQAGEFVGIFGPNGGGKSTFLKLLMGFLKPKKGKIEIGGVSPAAARRKIAYVPQIALFDKQFPISVLEVVLMGCLSELTLWGSYSEKSKRKAKEALEQVGMLEKQHQAFGTLSGGQAQRVLIARALASNPEILLLDEPTASIDTEAEGAIYNILSEMKGSKTILMVTHDLQTIHKQAERLLCIQRQLTSFSPNEVCAHFALGLYHPPLTKRPQP
jgi:zinc transport system ATP-binding protein